MADFSQRAAQCHAVPQADFILDHGAFNNDDRHPKIRRGALICAGATVLGNIEVGAKAIIAATQWCSNRCPQAL